MFKTAKPLLFGRLFFGIAVAACMAKPAYAQSADWIKQVARTIASKQTYPKAAQARGEEGTAKVKIFVAASGLVERAELSTPVGFQASGAE